MRRSRRLLWACLIAAAASGCERAQLRSVDDPRVRGFVLDAGHRADAGANSSVDAGAPNDGGSNPAPDAGPSTPPDAGVEPSCECPDLPITCTLPPLDTPLFTTEETAQVALLDLLACAETSVQAALYEVEWSCIGDALYDKLARTPALEVQLVVDDDQCPRDAEGKLTCALRDLEADPRVTVVDDARSRYMHHKFWVLDDQWVWTGSTNMTRTSFCTEVNDAIVLDDPAIVGAYAERFDALFTDRSFGPVAHDAPMQSGPYTLHFGPQSPLTAAPSWHDALLSAIHGAQTSVRFSVFAFTREDVAAAVAAAHARGVDVQGILHHRYSNNSASQLMQTAGVPLKKASVHTKVLVVDTASVATGSPNWSSNAWANNEDSLWIDDANVARAYEVEFDGLWQQAEGL